MPYRSSFIFEFFWHIVSSKSRLWHNATNPSLKESDAVWGSVQTAGRVSAPSSTLSRASPRQTAWLLLKDPEDAQPYLDELRRKSPEIASAATLAREFCRIIKERDTAAWPKWCEDTKTSLLATFAKYLCRDEAAVLAALQQPWSNGPVEGNIHRLKLIKRSMYGRAKFDLLRIRVMHAA